MIGIDSNVLLRYLVNDEAQARIARRIVNALTSEEPGYVSIVVLAEIAWVLKRSYKTPREQIGDAIETLLLSSEIVVEQKDVALKALGTYRRTTADFGDALIAHLAQRAGCSETVTLDRGAAAQTGMRLLK